jgi:plasmid stabilization system protein ParE
VTFIGPGAANRRQRKIRWRAEKMADMAKAGSLRPPALPLARTKSLIRARKNPRGGVFHRAGLSISKMRVDEPNSPTCFGRRYYFKAAS